MRKFRCRRSQERRPARLETVPAAGAAGGLLARPRALTTLAAVPEAAEDFFAGGEVTFDSLGLAPEVCSALQAAGYPRPAHAQELAVPAILRGGDVVLAAETGSGKSLAYLAPLLDWALRSRRAAAAAEAAAAEQQAEQQQEGWHGEVQRSGQRHHRRRGIATLVLCPNAALCEQVVAAATSLKDASSGAPLAATALVSSQSPPPLQLPDIVVTTPGALVSLMDNAGPVYGHEWTRAGLPEWARRVVFDEADLLLSGAYGAQMRIIWDALRAGDRLHAARRVCSQVGLSEDEFADLPYHLRRAALRGGAEGLLEAGFRPCRQPDSSSSSGSDAATQQQESGARAPGVHGASWRRQYVFVAATMPAEGERSVGAELATRFPDATWLAGRQLHQSKRALQHSWRQVEDEQHRAQVLHEVVAADEELQAGRGRMLVFARDVASAEATADALEGACGLPVLRYHKAVPAAERAEALARISQGSGLVLVCTDAAARGLDVPDVTHVVQADFAHSAIDFLHRVGRTARAGKAGRVTSLYSPEAAPLVDAIRDNIAAGQPVEGAFSRKRSFRKKFRKYGEYVPRGQEGPQANRQRPERAGRPERPERERRERRGRY
ncbi:DEAD-box ATP-dependent RNA helicase 22 [Chlorella sorokiniana]|uniref:DEAD-box ATP-dependent RNA helicase 22 n=1 Tax=Chlorella sorokiniana TaxID=3076 RepID=A0A2P6TCA1_CHLSO|nr:DEAD-box ATP-dependent RNA helicase 22 [Chlorella sorokiniana]|eukprot:PRW20256.1 DEAD-box ATP-dependent RNA helicase 22 [Chlorella sorokiniana]